MSDFLWPMDYNPPGSPVLHSLLEFAHIYVHWVGDAIYPSHLLPPFLLLPSIVPALRPFLMTQCFTSVGQINGVSGSVPPKNIQWIFRVDCLISIYIYTHTRAYIYIRSHINISELFSIFINILIYLYLISHWHGI